MKQRLVLLSLCLCQTALLAEDFSVPQFREVTREAGIQFLHINGAANVKNYIFEAKGGGIGWLDYDNDGWMDLWIVQGSTLERFRKDDNPQGALYRNLRNGKFEDVTDRAGLNKGAWGMGVTFGDYDNDGFTDIYLTNLGPNILYRNNGDGTFSDVTARAGVGDNRWSSSAGFGDYDGDGDLDLYVCNYISLDFNNLPEPGSDGYCYYKGQPVMCGPRGLPGSPDALYRNNGDGTFSDATVEAGVVDDRRLYGLALVWSDIDNDGDLDLYVANDDGPNLLHINNGKGTFTEMGLLSGLAVSMDGRNQGSMGVDVADYDNDGLLDVFITHFASDYSTLYHNRGDLLFEDITAQTPILESGWHQVGWGTRFVDLNHDGLKDIIYFNGHVTPFLIGSTTQETYFEPAALFLNEGDSGFRDFSKEVGTDFQEGRVSRGAAFADYDNDGDIDVAVANLNHSPTLLRTDLETNNHWIQFRLKGTVSNRDGLGGRITVRTGERNQVWEVKRTVSIFSASDPRAHFGLGQSSAAEEVSVRWPSGKVQTFKDVPADKHYLIEEDKGLSEEPILGRESGR